MTKGGEASFLLALVANMCGIDPYKTISQHFVMQRFKKKNLKSEFFSCLMMISWVCGFCLNEHQCFDEKDEKYHFKLCGDINKLKRAISLVQEDVLTPLQTKKIIVNVKLTDNIEKLTLADLKAELKKKQERIETAFEDAYRRNQHKKSQLVRARKIDSSKTNSNTRVNGSCLASSAASKSSSRSSLRTSSFESLDFKRNRLRERRWR